MDLPQRPLDGHSPRLPSYDALQTAHFPNPNSKTPLYASMLPLLETIVDSHHFACPWEILLAATKIADLKRSAAASSTPASFADEVSFAVSRIEPLDISKWAASFPVSWTGRRGGGGGRPSHLKTRMHIGEAYKSALLLFVACLLPAGVCLPATTGSHLNRIMYHLSLVPATDDGFKATSWPAFVAALGSEERETVAWALAHLRRVFDRGCAGGAAFGGNVQGGTGGVFGYTAWVAVSGVRMKVSRVVNVMF
ncbi:hypothetical protein B0J12DRAFT_704551 [Macrophomina phaseolina]|uniref:Uncharacterized protein n=1 Tax=Macrophomina phaseolina TaxID=35725 RepID=A0ABQ8FVF5_9PEZI|nr:hypothetical protein B0J12DRAFT_704551 [Macrophomina phaseolina]